MMKTRFFIMTAFVLGVSPCLADDPAEQAARYKRMMDRAVEMAREREAAAGTLAARPAPSPQQIRQALDEASSKSGVPGSNIGELVDRAYVRQQQGAAQKNTAAMTAAKTAEQDPGAIDPAEIAKLYRNPAMKGELSGPKEELVIFVSTSMPAETLKAIGTQAKRYGAVLVIRGVAGGFNGRNLRNTMRLLKPASDQGADIQIHPELFRKYSVTAVPTTVLSSAAGSGCEEGFCTQHASLVGDVSIEYALEQFSRRRDALGRIAAERLENARNGQ